MSKVICEICGTAYPDTETECPVCGFEKPETAEFAPDEMEVQASESASHVKGGRFSKANVSKKVKSSSKGKTVKKSKKKAKSDTGLIIAVVLLLLAIICFSAHIYLTYFAEDKKPAQDTQPIATTTEPTVQTFPQQTEGTTAPVDLSCTDLTLYEQTVVLNQVGSEWLLNVIPTPANTTDVINYASADQNVAIVTADGKIVAVGEGETEITVTCGDISVNCKVVCKLPVETEPQETEPEETEPDQTKPQETTPQETKPQETEPEETEPEETEPQDVGDFKLKKDDITFYGKGESYKLYEGKIDAEDIKWTVGNSAVATVKNGVVRAVGPGLTNVYAEYNGVKIRCVIRCDF